MKLRLQTPETYQEERAYIQHVLLSDFLGLEYDVQPMPRCDVVITEEDGRELVIADGLFRTPPDRWLSPASLPSQPLELWDTRTTGLTFPLVSPIIPVIFGDLARSRGPGQPDGTSPTSFLPVDIFGSCFFMLTRYEELVISDRDQHERFPAHASLAARAGFLERPIVNEYVEILWAYMARLWPTLKRTPRRHRTTVSHDVDWPLLGPSFRIQDFVRGSARAVLQRRSPAPHLSALSTYLRSRVSDARDPYDTFDWLMTQSEERGLKSAFYFICGHSGGRIDGVYSLGDPFIKQLLQTIAERGHEIGLHPSYNTFRSPRLLREEFGRLLDVTGRLGVQQQRWGGRQHFLRWEAPTTWRAWEAAGLHYDSSLGYADRVGFRAGTCYEFPVFDVQQRTKLALRERPLVVMEATLLEPDYMGLDHAQAAAMALLLKERCKQFSGDFTLLWHNSYLTTPRDRALYQTLLEP